MAESARHLAEEVLGSRPVRQWVLSFPYPLRFLFASKPETIGPVLGIVHRVIAGWLDVTLQVHRYQASRPRRHPNGHRRGLCVLRASRRRCRLALFTAT